MQKYYSLVYPEQIEFNPERYIDAISSMYLFSQSSYIGKVVDESSSYYLKQKNYLFGNLCRYNPLPLKSLHINVTQCETISHGVFKRGLSVFLRQGQKLCADYINGRVNLTAQALDELTLSISIIAVYTLDAIHTWQSEFTSKIMVQQQMNWTFSIIIISIVLLIHFSIYEIIVMGWIKQKFEFVRRIYDFYVPEFILVNQKVLKQKLIIQGLITNE